MERGASQANIPTPKKRHSITELPPLLPAPKGAPVWRRLTGSPLHNHHDTFAVGGGLHAHGLAVNQPIVAEGIAGLQVIGLLGRRGRVVN
jgi:hypothetical protein